MAFLFPSKRADVAVDFGTANIRVIRPLEGVVFDEPSLCCFARGAAAADLIAAGSDAYPMVDRIPGHLQIKRPLQRGVLQDIHAAREMLRYALSHTSQGKAAKASHGLFGVPADATQAERGALLTAARDAGFRSVRLVAEPFAAAVGADLPIDTPTGSMIVECGAGTTEVAVLSLGDICLTRSVRTGGAALNAAIADHLHLRHKFLIGEATAECVKHDYVQRRTDDAGATSSIDIKGRSLSSGMPALITIALSELDMVVEKHVTYIVDVVRGVLIDTPPELSRDIHDHGIVLTGGSAMTPLLRTMIEDATGLTVSVAADPARCVAQGLHRMLAATSH